MLKLIGRTGLVGTFSFVSTRQTNQRTLNLNADVLDASLFVLGALHLQPAGTKRRMPKVLVVCLERESSKW